MDSRNLTLKSYEILSESFLFHLFLTIKNKIWLGTKDTQDFHLQKTDQIRLYLVWLNDISNPLPAHGKNSFICYGAESFLIFAYHYCALRTLIQLAQWD